MTLENEPGKEITDAKVCLWGLNYLVNDSGDKKQLWKAHIMLLSLERYFFTHDGRQTLLPALLYSEAQSEN